MAGLSRAWLQHAVDTLKLPASERTSEGVHVLAVLLVDRLRAWPSKLPYNQLCDACSALSYSYMSPQMRMSDLDEAGQPVFRVLLSGSLLVQRRFEKSWLPVGFLRAGDTLGLPVMFDASSDDIRYTTLHEAAEFAVLRQSSFERFLRNAYEKMIVANVTVLQRTPSFGNLPEGTLRQLVSSSRLVTLPPGELLTREGDATDEMFVLKSGAVRLVKSLKTTQTFRWPTTRTLEDDESFSFTTHGDELTGLRGPVEFKRAPSLSASGREALDSALKKPEERERGMTPLDRRTSITNRRGSTDARRSSIRRSSMRRSSMRMDAEEEGPSKTDARRSSMRRSSMRRSSMRMDAEEEDAPSKSITRSPDTKRVSLSVAFAEPQEPELEQDDASKVPIEKEKCREVARIHRDRIVVVGEIREGQSFAYDEAISVIRRIALARSTGRTASSFKELDPIRRSVTSFCMTEVQAIALSPLVLLLFVGHDKLAPFIRSFGTARSGHELDKHLRQQREWKQFKQSLLDESSDRPPTMLKSLIGPRKFARQTVDAIAPSERAGAMSERKSSPGKRRVLDGLQTMVHGAASAELAAASSDVGTTITEYTTIRNHLEPSSVEGRRRAASARHAYRNRHKSSDGSVQLLPGGINPADLMALKVREIGRMGSVLSAITSRPR